MYKETPSLTLGITDAVDVMHAHARLLDGVLDDFECPLAMMQRRILRLKSLAWWRVVCVPNIGEHGRGLVRGMADDPRAELVRGALEAEREQRPLCTQLIRRVDQVP
jgi:hypothetical protein